MRREEQSDPQLSDVSMNMWHQLTVSLSHTDSETCLCTKVMAGCKEANTISKTKKREKVSVAESVITSEAQNAPCHIDYVLFSPPAAVFLLKSTFKAKAKHFKLWWPSIVATWRDANGFIVRP